MAESAVVGALKKSAETHFFNSHGTQRALALDGVQLASFLRRAGALYIDLVLVALIFVLTKLPYALVQSRAGQHVTIQFHPFDDWQSTVAVLLYSPLMLWLLNGRTLGKLLMRIRVVSLVHERLNFWHALERSLGYGASALEGGFGFMQYFIHPNRQTVHDRIAETIVVRESALRATHAKNA